jgi:hypothetical protein
MKPDDCKPKMADGKDGALGDRSLPGRPNPDNKDHLRALLAAYNEVTKMDVAFTSGRESMLRRIDRLGLTPADMAAVVLELKRLVESDPKRYPEACLDFHNVCFDHDRFETRAKRLRARKERRAGRKVERPASNVPHPTSNEEAAIRERAKAAAAEFRARMNRGGGQA